MGGGRGVTQGKPLSPTIFNVVVNAVVRHWVNRVVEEAEAKGETGREGRHQAALLYADDGMVASSQPPSPTTTSSMVSGRVVAQVPAPSRSTGGLLRDII